jgi:peptidoglycan/LPS O-acetylase OafA/YrhL
LTSRALGVIAKISYSAYLFHILLLNQVYRFLQATLPNQTGDPLWFLFGALITIMLTIVVSSIIYVALEKPFIDLTHKR